MTDDPAQRRRDRRPHRRRRDSPEAAVEESLAAHRGPQRRAQRVLGRAGQRGARAGAVPRARRRASARGPLYGVPVAIKEELDVAGCVTTFGGTATARPRPPDGEVVRRLRAAGAIVVGKTHMPEFGAWPYTESVAYGYTRNPWRTGFTPGGSSGGSAAAVASGMVPIGMGGDGGGSIRIPAACCGLFGLKPQRGRVTSSPHGAPVVGARHRRPADPHGARLRDRLRRDPRQPADRPVAGAARSARSSRPPGASRAGSGSAGR